MRPRHALLLPLLALCAPAGCKKETRPPSLAESLSVEQPGGTATQLIAQGSQLPTSATEKFTTAKDDEKRLHLHVLRGSGKSADKLHSEGWWLIDGVGSAPAGQAQVVVTFELDAQGALAVSAREDERKLSAKKLDPAHAQGKLSPSPLTEPDDDDDLETDQE